MMSEYSFLVGLQIYNVCVPSIRVLVPNTGKFPQIPGGNHAIFVVFGF